MKSENSHAGSYASKFRRRRMEKLASLIEIKKLQGVSVLDIGGTKNFWEMNLEYLPKGAISEIDIVNLPPQDNAEFDLNGVMLRFYGGDALDEASFRKQNYDLVHSNSVIEHVGNLSSQKRMSESIQRLGTFYWVQSPAKAFPLEPHFYVPFFAYLPLSLRAALLRRFNLGFHKREPDWLQSRITCEDTRLLTLREYKCLFPQAEILSEKVAFFTKSYTATNLA
ncbi:hypothetical protein [Arenicella xantha]|uniref:Methyltransferase family protein n=1 Tax=Arenicella xantha TaxID=644221 RepID=A0A395JPG3_9GAMM|nr:hypothetical protein [Arenicella xantha]RBP51687.1 hypothetical protein DFR28_1021119 [Arenicella xantha]